MNPAATHVDPSDDRLLIQPRTESEWDVEPCRGLVLVELKKDEDMTAGGLVIPEKAKANRLTPRWEVVKVGEPDVTLNGDEIPLPCKVGDRVLISAERGRGWDMPTDPPLRLVELSAIIGVATRRTN